MSFFLDDENEQRAVRLDSDQQRAYDALIAKSATIPTHTLKGVSEAKKAKTRYTLLPWGWLPALGRVAMGGADKHGDFGWRDLEKYPVQGYVDALMRHLAPILARGLDARDGDTGELHIHHLAWNALRLSDYMETGK